MAKVIKFHKSVFNRPTVLFSAISQFYSVLDICIGQIFLRNFISSYIKNLGVIYTHTYLRICHSYFPRFSVNYSYEECTNVPCPYITNVIMKILLMKKRNYEKQFMTFVTIIRLSTNSNSQELLSSFVHHTFFIFKKILLNNSLQLCSILNRKQIIFLYAWFWAFILQSWSLEIIIFETIKNKKNQLLSLHDKFYSYHFVLEYLFR